MTQAESSVYRYHYDQNSGGTRLATENGRTWTGGRSPLVPERGWDLPFFVRLAMSIRCLSQRRSSSLVPQLRLNDLLMTTFPHPLGIWRLPGPTSALRAANGCRTRAAPSPAQRALVAVSSVVDVGQTLQETDCSHDGGDRWALRHQERHHGSHW